MVKAAYGRGLGGGHTVNQENDMRCMARVGLVKTQLLVIFTKLRLSGHASVTEALSHLSTLKFKYELDWLVHIVEFTCCVAQFPM